MLEREDEFDAFFDAHYPGLLRSLTMITGDAELATDALQDAFVRAYARWRRIRRYERPEAWVRRVAINRSRDLMRSDARRRAREQQVARTESEPSLDGSTDDAMAMQQLLLALPERQRIAVTLFYVDDLSIEQVADAMGITSGAVKYHLNQGRQNLRDRPEAPDEP